MIVISRRVQIVGFFAVLLAVDWFLYFRHAGHFFQGDTIFLLNHRAVTLTQFFERFIRLNPSGWYRPLAFEVFESVLYPFAGLHPVPYRIPVYLAFVALTVTVFVLALELSRRHLVAAVASFFFTIHLTSVYATYDMGFLPELLYSLFYTAGVLAYVRYVLYRSKPAYWLSLAALIGSLLSKEAAVTLPAALFLAGMIFAPRETGFRESLMRVIRTTTPHILIVVTYLGFAVGYLGVQNFSIRRMFDRSQVVNKGDYVPVFRSGIFQNADLAVTWAFNIRRGEWYQGQHDTGNTLTYLKLFRALVLGLIGLIFIARHREFVSLILFGCGWFWLTLAPALPLVAHFLPYYLFLPVVGLSLAVGAAFTWLYDQTKLIQPMLAQSIISAVLIGELFVVSTPAEAEIRDNPLLGRSASLAGNTLNDLMQLYPKMAENVTIYFVDAEQPLAWHHDLGGLIRMAYDSDRLFALYESHGDVVLPDSGNVMVFDVRDGHLADITSRYRLDPASFIKFTESPHQLEISPDEVTAGRDKYMLRITGLRNTAARIGYKVNDGPFETFVTMLDDEGKVTFDVSSDIRRGTYKFLAFNISGTAEWIRAERTLTIH
jgi:hypothetical protein